VEARRRAADEMYLPYDGKAQVHLQDEHFLDLEPWTSIAVADAGTYRTVEEYLVDARDAVMPA
jgi:trehalose/maltose hydrolase-like predicted phosphorylase